MTVTAKRYLKQLDKGMPASTTTRSSASTQAVVELSQRASQGVSKGTRSTRRLRGQLLTKDGVRKARGLRLVRHQQPWSHGSRGVSRSRRTEVRQPSRRRPSIRRQLCAAHRARLRLGAAQERLRQSQRPRRPRRRWMTAGVAMETTWWLSTSVRTAKSPSIRRQGD